MMLAGLPYLRNSLEYVHNRAILHLCVVSRAAMNIVAFVIAKNYYCTYVFFVSSPLSPCCLLFTSFSSFSYL
jgi:hypothetical protein